MSEKILISTTTFAEFDSTPLNLLKDKGLSHILNPYERKLKVEEIVNLGKEAVGIVAGTEWLGDEVFSQLPRLKVISRCGVGVDNVDLESAQKRGIKVYNTASVPTTAVAELTVGLILSLLRKVNQMEHILRDSNWKKLMGNLLYEKKVGIIGFGRIGQKVCELISSFGVELAYYDVEPKSYSVNCKMKGFEEIIRWADIITLHVSTADTLIIGSRELKMMKKGSWLINTSRGGVVDEKALYGVLKNGHLSGAALDVFEEEPYSGPLKELPNVLLTPHIGSYAKETRIKMEIQAIENLLVGLGDSRNQKNP